jgi:hypothetical protein
MNDENLSIEQLEQQTIFMAENHQKLAGSGDLAKKMLLRSQPAANWLRQQIYHECGHVAQAWRQGQRVYGIEFKDGSQAITHLSPFEPGAVGNLPSDEEKAAEVADNMAGVQLPLDMEKIEAHTLSDIQRDWPKIEIMAKYVLARCAQASEFPLVITGAELEGLFSTPAQWNRHFGLGFERIDCEVV